jgi:O-antigen/teichoic acid export membrane protein
MSAAPPPGHGVLAKFGALLLSRWLKEGLQALFLIYLARVSAPRFGEFVLALELGAVVLLAAEFGFNVALVPHLGRNPEEAKAAVSRISCLKALLLGLVWLGLAGLVHWQGYPPELQRVVLLLAGGVGLEALASTFFTWLQVQGRQAAEGRLRAAAAVVGLGYAFLTLAAGAPSVVVALFKIWENLVNLAGVLWLLGRPRPWPLSRPALGDLWATFRQGIHFGLLAVLSALLSRVNLLFLQSYGGSAQVAQYGAAWPLVDGLHAIISGLLLQSVLYPLFVRLTADDPGELSRLARHAGQWLLGLSLIIALALALEKDRLIPLIFGPQYPEAVEVLGILVFSVPLVFLQSLAGFALLSLRQERLLVIFFGGGLLFALAFCSLTVPRWPLAGAAWAMVFSRGLVTGAALWAIHRRLPLLSWRPAVLLLLAAGLGWGLCRGLSPFLPREAAELLGLAPLMAALWRQRLARG